MAKRGLSHPDHLRLGQVLAGLRAELLHQQVGLQNAYPQSGPRSVPAKQLKKALELLDEARRKLENVVHDEHPSLAQTYDYFPHEEHRAQLVVPEKPGSAPGPVPSGR
jgi:hypothetical protein